MKTTLRKIFVLLLALLITVQLPMQVFAQNADAKYISEIKLGVGKNAEDALAALEGYEILKDANGNYVDLNKDAGGGVGSKGDRVVYLGFKRTSNSADAITDLAVMNMKGGYSVQDYDALMENYVKEQIIPFVNTFLSAIEEYRENYNSSIAENRARAHYIHDALNMLTDDDCGGAGLGDLLLNETKFELGDAAYNALSAEQKKQHADIVTIIAQANGQATLLLENLLLKAADTAENTWLDRFLETSYEDMEYDTGLSPSKAYAELSRLYYDDAMKILEMWDAFKAQLDGYDESMALLNEITDFELNAEKAVIEGYDLASDDAQETTSFADSYAKINVYGEAYVNAYTDVVCREYISALEYDLSYFDFETEDDTLLDLFSLEYEDVYDNIECLYPLVASLSPGQRAGLDFVTLEELILIGINDSEGYLNAAYDELEPYSIYTGVDRAIYAKGGVGLTSDALRQDALSNLPEDSDKIDLGGLTIASYALTGASLIGLGVSLAARASYTAAAAKTLTKITGILQSNLEKATEALEAAGRINSAMSTAFQEAKEVIRVTEASGAQVTEEMLAARDAYFKMWQNSSAISSDLSENIRALKSTIEAPVEDGVSVVSSENGRLFNRMNARSSLCGKLAIGFTVAIVIFTAISVWMTFRDLKNHYKVEFTPIPGYMVDEKDITTYNSMGEKIVVKNQGAYYKAVLCNRTSGDYYDVLGDKGDLNGYVGKQWLALYAEKNAANDPILADSFTFTDQAQIPAGYAKGIHMFGSAGSAFSVGTLAVGALGGLSIGVLGTLLCVNLLKKKKETAAA